ncbi:16S rRNA (cytosine(1407)-C(5))-methyltransferase RsmF [Parashewanella curva]|uniref:Ribosomal RNA small subunit methyltransferase F n=1 Tax=Parashewanella curva TaxID=2338552 RepID=A0A3L8PTS0_9GAMM|nr:16S rRNA (cytosine(1407)-C(5))-methyltransferase RsmF [Parashewanella curva]RLV58807.1 16S rRNA (cytosine(1407)-C(5))-methyltransferase RsmF [Parashewanella curva]
MNKISENFIEHIRQQLPCHLSLDEFLAFNNKPLRLSVRVNTLKITVSAFHDLMSSKGWRLTSIPWCKEGFWITIPPHQDIGNSIEHLQGLFYIQEASSMLPPTALFDSDSNFDNVLDMAAAPGSKTTQIAALMNNQGLLIANEYSSSRVKMLHANLVRMGVYNAAITHFDAEVFGQYLFEAFDAILLDAPCGGEGTVRKDSNALKDWRLEEVHSIATKQKQLIVSAFEALKVNGTLIYSTCTLSQEENQQVCLFLKETFGDAVEFISLADLFNGANKATTSEGFLHIWPQIFDSEGFFVAKIRKTKSVTRSQPEPKINKNFPFKELSIKQEKEITDWLLENYSISIPASLYLVTRDNQFWLFPKAIKSYIGKIRFQRIGLKLAEQKGKHLKITHEVISVLYRYQSDAINANEQQAEEYLKGRDIQLEQVTKPQGEKIICSNKVALGLIKHLGTKLKNNLPRDLVRDNAVKL